MKEKKYCFLLVFNCMRRMKRVLFGLWNVLTIEHLISHQTKAEML